MPTCIEAECKNCKRKEFLASIAADPLTEEEEWFAFALYCHGCMSKVEWSKGLNLKENLLEYFGAEEKNWELLGEEKTKQKADEFVKTKKCPVCEQGELTKQPFCSACGSTEFMIDDFWAKRLGFKED